MIILRLKIHRKQLKKKPKKFTSHAKMHTPKMAFVISNKQSRTVAVKKLTKWQKSKNPHNYKTSG